MEPNTELTLQNSLALTDFTLDEHIYSSISSKATNLSSISQLRHENPVILFTATGKKLPAAVVFSEDYENLQILVRATKKVILTRDIKEISQSFIIQVQREEDNLFPVRVKTKEKQYLWAFLCKEQRELWCNSLDCLLKCVLAHESPGMLRSYCEFVVRNQETGVRAAGLNESHLNYLERIKVLEKNIRKFEKWTVKSMMDELVTRVETKLHYKKIKEIRFQIANLESEKILLLKNQEGLIRSLRKKEEESGLLRETLQSFKEEMRTVSKPKVYKNYWIMVFPFLWFRDLLMVSRVNRKFSNWVYSYLSLQLSWQVLTRSPLIPRSKSWNFYLSCFLKDKFPVSYDALSKSQCSEKNLVLLKSMSTQSPDVQKLSILFCECFKITSCFAELGKIVNYVFFVTKDRRIAFEVMHSLANPPYYLFEIWKPGLIRLRLGVFQVQKMLKLRHPYLHRHFRQIDISLDYIITPWIGTLFTCYFCNGGSNEAVNRIWDLFILKGWNAVVGCCLALLFNSQDKVIGESLENTVKFYKKDIESKEVLDVLDKYSVDSGFLNELEKLFYFSLEN